MINNPEAAEEIRRRHLTNLMGEMRDILPFLDNRELTDIFIYGDGKVVIDHFIDGTIDTNIIISVERRRRIIHYLASMAGTPIDTWREPTLEGIIPQYNARITGVLEPWVCSPEITIRRPPSRIHTLEDYLKEKRITHAYYKKLIDSIRNKENILIGGGTGAGKTTFVNACIDKMSELFPKDRILIIEDTPELQCNSKYMTKLYIRKDQAVHAVAFALRWKPKRIIFGELRNGEVARELIEAWNTGHPGNLTTIHADSAQTMMNRLRGMLSQVITGELPEISDSIQLCVHLSYKAGFGPVVDEILHTKKIKKNAKTIELLNIKKTYGGYKDEVKEENAL